MRFATQAASATQAAKKCPFCPPPPEHILIERPLAFVKRDGYNIGINNGPAAGQTVMHVHLIPRHLGGTSDAHGGIRMIIPERAKYWKK